ncbi:MAG: FAD/NAD(P)-binding oxidoreductase [Rhodospirillaceae bacterium]|jgi:NADPH-dependent 2,4-dienoyl-CoA reductase/sulfur reductase-like enzyme
MRDNYDFAVIGAGPAGMAAAIEASARGVSTLLLDEQPEPGGQIYRAIESSPILNTDVLGPDYVHGTVLAKQLRESDVDYQPASTVWDITHDRFIGVETHGASRFIQAKRILIATGAYERPFPVPGWTLPGVMSVGAAQILLKTTGATPGPKTVIAGTGPLLYLFVWQLLRGGIQVQAVLDTTPTSNYFKALSYLPTAWKSRSILKKGMKFLTDMNAAKVNWITRATKLHIEGESGVTAIHYRRGEKDFRLETDMVLLHQGVVPNIQLSRAIGCEHVWNDQQLCWMPVTDVWGQTSIEGVFIAGDGCGIDGAKSAEHAGRLSALQICHELNKIDEAARDKAAVPARDALLFEWRVRPFLDVMYRPEEPFRTPPQDDVLACRCEEVTTGQIRQAVMQGCAGPNQLKSFTRAGMGPCQGRMCGLTVCETIAQARGVSPAEVGYYRLRPPIKPIPLGSVADMPVPGEDPDRDFNDALETKNEDASEFSETPVWS